MENNSKVIKLNRLSFCFYLLYLITYVLGPIIDGNPNYLFFVVFPLLFLISFIINLRIYYDNKEITGVDKTKNVFSLLFNGFKLDKNGIRSDNDKTDVYPSIRPIWLFSLLLVTVLCNFSLWAILSEFPFWNTYITNRTYLLISIVSTIFIQLGLITSASATYINDKKEENIRFWRIIVAVIFCLIIVFCYSIFAK